MAKRTYGVATNPLLESAIVGAGVLFESICHHAPFHPVVCLVTQVFFTQQALVGVI